MRTSTFRQLDSIRNQYGPGVFGKIAQKLLAVALFDAGFVHVVERGVQGVDVDAVDSEGQKYAMEVKTTDKKGVPVSTENIEALKARSKDGYVPIIAALRMQLLEDWIFASIPLTALQPGSLPFSRLRAYRVSDLETLTRPFFEAAVDEHVAGVLSRGEHYLSRVLADKREQISG